MSLSLLLEKYDVSTEEGLQKALNDIEKEESEVDEALAGVLSRACSLEGRLRTATEAYVKLGEVKTDAQSAADMVDTTAMLARDVSAKVRQLDLARSRVAECQRRVHDLIDLQLCSAGVEAAINAHDYETGAMHVARFLSMDPGSVAAARARGAPDPRRAMAAAADTLRDHLVRKFEEAARKEDEAAVERLLKLFPQIGRADEGVDLLAKYLAKQVDVSIRKASVVAAPAPGKAVYADAFTRALRAAAAAVRRARSLAPGRLPAALTVLQPSVDAGVRRLYRELAAAHRLEASAPAGAAAAGAGAGGAGDADPLAAEPVIAELALVHATIGMYFTLLRRNLELDAEGAGGCAGGEGGEGGGEAARRLVAGSGLARTAHDVLGHYLDLEKYFLEESVNKALRLAAPRAGARTSSLVDDVFFIARKVIRRSMTSGSVEAVCCVLNEAAARLEAGPAGALRRWLRAAPPDPLPLPAPLAALPAAPHAAPDAGAPALAHRLNQELDAQRALYLAHMNEAEAGAEWSERLAGEAVSEGEALVRAEGGAAGAERARTKLQSCAGGLGAAAAAFRAAHDTALAAVRARLQPRLLAWADWLVAPPLHEDGMEDDAAALPGALDVLAEAARDELSPRAADLLLPALVLELAARAEARLLQHNYDRESGLCVERRLRRLAAWAGGGAGGARERCARLTQAGALLAAERVQHAPLALQPAARLAPADVRSVLARRIDFKMEDIKRLKL